MTVLPRSITSAPVSLLKIRASSSFGGTAGVCEHVFEWVSIRSNHQQYSACKGKIKNMEPESYGTIPIKDILKNTFRSQGIPCAILVATDQ